MTANDFKNLQDATFFHCTNSGAEFVLVQKMPMSCNAVCTKAGGDYIQGKTYGFLYESYKTAVLKEGKAVQQSPWISCKERMPNEGDVVFVSTLAHGHYVAFVESYEGRIYFIEKQECIELDVVYWMPIPE